jgi:hypothetical protein
MFPFNPDPDEQENPLGLILPMAEVLERIAPAKPTSLIRLARYIYEARWIGPYEEDLEYIRRAKGAKLLGRPIWEGNGVTMQRFSIIRMPDEDRWK